MALEVEAQVEQRLAKHAGVAQQQRDEEPSDTTVAVEEGVDRLELQGVGADIGGVGGRRHAPRSGRCLARAVKCRDRA
jgi:hypothetical protein